jgi:hypothetical protein
MSAAPGISLVGTAVLSTALEWGLYGNAGIYISISITLQYQLPFRRIFRAAFWSNIIRIVSEVAS